MANLSQDIGAQVASLERAIKTSLNADLKELCRSEGLLVSGVKATLQNRILDRKAFLPDYFQTWHAR